LEGISGKARVAPTVFTHIIHQALSIISTRSRFTQTQHRLIDWHTPLDGVDGFCEARLAGAALDTVHHNTFCICPTRVWLALLHWFDTGNGRRVAFKSRQTVAHRAVCNHPTPCIGSTLVTTTLGTICDAANKRVSCLPSWTRADGVSIVEFTDGASATWRGDAGVGGR
jgi:hypothetical protein